MRGKRVKIREINMTVSVRFGETSGYKTSRLDHLQCSLIIKSKRACLDESSDDVERFEKKRQGLIM